MLKLLKLEIIDYSPNYYRILQHYLLFGFFRYSSYVKDYNGLADDWSDFESAEKWVEDTINWEEHKIKTVKVYDLE